jgi:hypothetical protein
MNNQKIDVEIQYFHGCPNSEEALKRVKSVIAELNQIEFNFRETLVSDLTTAQKVNFRGSPTILINGNDVEGMPENLSPALSCRLYPNGLPTEAKLKEFVNNLTGV